MRLVRVLLLCMPPAALLVLIACGGGDGGGNTPPPQGPNHPPSATVTRDDLRVQVGEPVSVDATRGGTRMADPDGDALDYRITLRGAAGLTVVGTRIVGALTSVGAVEVTVTATDPYDA